jgi:hypothetical protein
MKEEAMMMKAKELVRRVEEDTTQKDKTGK